MPRQQTTKTRYPGVYRVEDKPSTYRVWGQVRDPKTGKNRTLDKMIEATSPHDANDQRADLLAKLLVHKPKVERKKLEEYATSWLRSKLPKLKPSTRYLYTNILANHIIPKLGDYYLDAIEADDITKWRDELPGEPASINGRLRVLKTLFADAVADENLPGDPTRRVEAMREVTTEDDEAKSITAVELRALVEAARVHTPKWYPFFYTLAFTGLRFGEVTALRWTDVDEVNGKIWIRRAQWQGKIDTTKNNKTRSMPLMPEQLAVFQAHRLAQQKAMIKRLRRQRVPQLDAKAHAMAEWVFPGRIGKLMHNTAPRKALHLAMEKAKLNREFTVHGFRHTFNNLARSVAQGKGMDIVLRSMTGHSSEEMTEHYSHVALEEKREVVGKLLRLVQGGG